eukprot:1140308-Pelagomonas_calceolata.AAC.2
MHMHTTGPPWPCAWAHVHAWVTGQRNNKSLHRLGWQPDWRRLLLPTPFDDCYLSATIYLYSHALQGLVDLACCHRALLQHKILLGGGLVPHRRWSPHHAARSHIHLHAHKEAGGAVRVCMIQQGRNSTSSSLSCRTSVQTDKQAVGTEPLEAEAAAVRVCAA